MNPKQEERIIVALDVGNLEEARHYLELLQGLPIWGVKVGLELCTAVGAPTAVALVKEFGRQVMLDLKFADIPNTMAGAARSAASLGVDMFTIHASSGRESIAAAVKNCGDAKVLGVTVLTSIDDTECPLIFGNGTERTVINLAHQAFEQKAHGLVCSPKELMALRNRGFDEFTLVVPGIRPEWAAAGDQRRVMTPAGAIRAGATHLVIGRPILNPPEGMTSLTAVDAIIKEIEGA